ncbi:MAG: anthranilate synthase component I [Cyanobacteria bacterium P01_D01_bin.156]
MVLSSSLSQLRLSPRYWQRLNLQHYSGADIFEALFAADKIATLLESPGHVDGASQDLIRYSLCAGGPQNSEGQLHLFTPEIGEILTTLNQLLKYGQQSSLVASASPDVPPEYLPFLGGWLGWLGFDTAWEIETLPYLNPDSLPFPVAYWYEPEEFAILDHQQQDLWLAATTQSGLVAMAKRITAYQSHSHNDYSPRQGTSRITFCSDQHQFETAIQTAKDYIRAGDVFQVNLSLRFHTETHSSPWKLYRQLHTINPSPFSSYWCTPWGQVISCSPERLVQLQRDTAQTRPIAGTRPRGNTPVQDRSLAKTLQNNHKERAEHIMLVDLERNDLGRVCTWGSIEVNELMVIERYSHVMHLVSNVIGTLQPNLNAVDLIRATFPGGTITGCPKVRCMEIIEALEPVRRSLFYGSCGYLDRRGQLDLNILIRTLLLAPINTHTHQVWGQVGAGIVADSDPHQEWLESLQKAKAQLLALGVGLES